MDEDNLSGDGEVGVAIRNAPPEPAIVYPEWYVTSDPHLSLEGVVRSAERLTVRVWDGDTQVGETRSVGWNPTLGVNWQTVVTLTGEGLHSLSADSVSDFGLASERGLAVTFLLDTRPPTVTLAALPPFTTARAWSWPGKGTTLRQALRQACILSMVRFPQKVVPLEAVFIVIPQATREPSQA